MQKGPWALCTESGQLIQAKSILWGYATNLNIYFGRRVKNQGTKNGNKSETPVYHPVTASKLIKINLWNIIYMQRFSLMFVFPSLIAPAPLSFWIYLILFANYSPCLFTKSFPVSKENKTFSKMFIFRAGWVWWLGVRNNHMSGNTPKMQTPVMLGAPLLLLVKSHYLHRHTHICI